jgi:AcrR family transcriptional regulator
MASSDTAPPARVRNARGEGDRLREQLVAATVTLLEQEGDEDRVSVRAIAKAAGVSPTALYLHFPDRDALVAAAVDRGFAAFNAAILTASRSDTEPLARVRAMGLAYLDFVERQPALYAVIFSARRTASRPSGELPVDRREALDALAAAVAAARPPGAPRDEDELALTFWAGLHGYAVLRARPPIERWPGSAAYVERLLRAHLGV